jgi:voltage-gated potassium channel Kch
MVQQCQYVTPDDVQCLDDAQDGHTLCIWHDPAIDKSGPGWAARLEALAADGQSLAGFELARAHLDGINLTFPDQDNGVDLRYANLQRASLKGARLYRADFSAANLLKANLSETNLNAAKFENADLLGTVFGGAHMDGIDWGASVRQENEARAADKAGQLGLAVEKFREAEEIYRDLRMTSELHGHRRMAGEFFFREMLMRHYRLPRFSAVRWVSRFAHVIYGYGERPVHIISCALAYLLFFAILFFWLGVNDHGVYEAFDPAKGLVYNLSVFGHCLYFSVVTFTTVGYGDVLAHDGWTRAIAAFEALSGNFIMALFVVVFVRKLAR